MKRIIIYLTAALMAAGASSLLADSSTNTTSQAENPGQKLKDMTPAERKAYIADHPELAKRQQERKAAMERMGLDPKELRSLSPDDRKAKIKDAAETTVKELEAKKASGGLSEQEQTDLTFIKNNILGHKKHKPAADN
jgi:hypothetical protein